MPIEFRKCSPEAIEKGKKASRSKYPFDELEIGSSFVIPVTESNYYTLYTRASTLSKNGKRFVFVHHEALGLYEVARIS